MKNIVFFITHKTLTIDHAEMTFRSISNQMCNAKMDTLYIYNSNSDELSNNVILDIIEKSNAKQFFNTIEIFDYDPRSNKSLATDIENIRNFSKNNFNLEDRILLLKSDIVLSKYYFDDILNNTPKDRPIYFVSPFICAKKRVTNDQILQYSLRDVYVKSDNITFFVEDRYQSGDNDFNNRPGINVTDHSILFTSCYVIRDFSCHFISVSLLDLIQIRNQTWGGVWFSNLEPYFIETERSFTIHKYHNIISENRSSGREGPVESWITS
jgi:hypothetical protein